VDILYGLEHIHVWLDWFEIAELMVHIPADENVGDL